jgi:hypothetical protein
VYQKQLDINNVIEEAGDILFYLTGLLNELGLTINDCMEANVAKLSKRYPQHQYSNEAAIARADKLDVIEEPVVLKDDDDLADIKVERTCRIEDPECESCQSGVIYGIYYRLYRISSYYTVCCIRWHERV